MSREEPAIDLDRALHYAAARVEVHGEWSGERPIYIVSADNPRLPQETPALTGIFQLRRYAREHSIRALDAIGGDFLDRHPPEASLALVDVSQARAKSVSKAFGQEAFFRVTPSSQDVVFVRGGEICAAKDDVEGRRRSLTEDLTTFVHRKFGIDVEAPDTLRRRQSWHVVGDPMTYLSIPSAPSGLVVLRTLNDGTDAYRQSVALLDLGTRQLQKIELPEEVLEDGSLNSVISSRIHLDRCHWSDEIRGLTESRYRIYVWQSLDSYPDAPSGSTSVYVGVTGRTVHERLNEHRVERKRSVRWVREYEGALNHALMPDVVLPSSPSAKAFEEWWANRLRYDGYFAKGGH